MTKQKNKTECDPSVTVTTNKVIYGGFIVDMKNPEMDVSIYFFEMGQLVD